MNKYTWLKEPREIPALGKVVATGESFEADEKIGQQLVRQKLAQAVPAAAPAASKKAEKAEK